MLRRDPNCTLCKLHKTAEYVCLLGVGPQKCEVMFIGEAPGKREDDSGKPFVGKAGGVLEDFMSKQGFTREEVFITNAVSCRPPDNRKPTKAEIKSCNKWLAYQLAMVKPKFVLLLGATAYQAITGTAGITKARGRPFEKDGITFLPTLHPASTFYDDRAADLIDLDFELFRKIVDGGGVPRERDLNPISVRTWKQFDQMIAAMRGVVSYDIETTCLYPWGEFIDTKKPEKGRIEPLITSLGFGTSAGEYTIPWRHPQSPWKPADLEKMLERIEEAMDDCIIITHFGKIDALWIAVLHNRWWNKFFDFDTGMAHYNIDENALHGLKELAQFYFGAPDWDIDKGKDRLTWWHDLEKLTIYHAHDLFYTRKLHSLLRDELKKDPAVERLFYHLTMPAVRLYIEIEYDGVCINKTKFGDCEKELRKQIAASEIRLRDEYVKGMRKRRAPVPSTEELEEINWGSTKQVGKIFFENLGIAGVEQTKKGAWSTSESVMKRIDHPLAGEMIKFRGWRQQLSFFIEGWKPYLVRQTLGDHVSWFLHPSFKLHGTVTGRPSCEHPNLQQVPRDEFIRSLITAPPGWTLIEADLEQIELKIVAELSRDPEMMNAFRKGVDIHWLTMIRELERGGGMKELVLDTARTAKQDKSIGYAEALEIVFNLGPALASEIRKEWKEMRKRAKAINFGYVYGMWWKKFKLYARDNYDIIVTDEEAQESRKSFFSLYRLEKWHDKQRSFARRNGYVRSLSGRKRRLPNAQLPEDTGERREAERQAINSPVQGFAPDIITMSMLQLREEFGRNKVRPCATVHDAILAWVRNEYLVPVLSRLLVIMQRPKLFDLFEIELDVPITAEGKVGPWSQGVEFNKWRKQNASRA